PVYADAAAERIASVRPLPTPALQTPKPKRAEPRIPFGTIIELRILEPAIVLTEKPGRLPPEVRPDATRSLAAPRGPFHGVGAEVQGKSACNGWTFWHYEAQGVLKPIDALREQARRRLGLSAPVPLGGLGPE